MTSAALITFTTALFAVINPFGSTAIFIGMVTGHSAAERRSIAIRASIAVAVILLTSIWAGEYVLRLFDVGIPGLETAGGIMITLIALSMLQNNANPVNDSTDGSSAAPKQDIAIVPLAMPVIAGPGSIVTVIVNTHLYHGVESNLKMSLVSIAIAGIVCVCLLSSKAIAKALGTNGMNILTKFMGMVLLAIAMGMLTEGLKGLLPGLA
ncbi:MAG TPA: MarC family protein [Pseudomonadales bacterium]|jgi:multiple antibiotic resistance protein